MPRHRHLFRIQERAAGRPAGGRRGHRQPRRIQRPLPVSYCGVLFQRGQFSFVRGKSLPSVPRASKQWQTAVAIAKIVDQDLKDSAVGNALVLPRPLRLAGLAAEARRLDRQPHLLSLIGQPSLCAASRPSSIRIPGLAALTFCSRLAHGAAARFHLLRRCAADRCRRRARGRRGCSAARTCSRCAKCPCPTAAAPT